MTFGPLWRTRVVAISFFWGRVQDLDSRIWMKEIEEVVLQLSARLKDRKIYAELDDFGGTSLKMMVEYLIPKRRGELPRKRGGADA